MEGDLIKRDSTPSLRRNYGETLKRRKNIRNLGEFSNGPQIFAQKKMVTRFAIR